MNNEQRNIERGRCAGHQFETTFSHPRKLRLVIRHKRGGRALREGSEDQARRNFSDDTLCIPVGQRAPIVSKRKGEQPLQIRLVPNPANEIVRIEGLTLGTNEVAVVELADLNGRIIETTSLTGDQPAFNLNQVPQGVYSCRIIKNGMLFQTLKLIVIH